MHLREYFCWDYFLDSLDRAQGVAGFSAFSPRLSFDPGQRYLVKGSYILALARNGAAPRHLDRSLTGGVVAGQARTGQALSRLPQYSRQRHKPRPAH
jgi:hypothetical protein